MSIAPGKQQPTALGVCHRNHCAHPWDAPLRNEQLIALNERHCHALGTNIHAHVLAHNKPAMFALVTVLTSAVLTESKDHWEQFSVDAVTYHDCQPLLRGDECNVLVPLVDSTWCCKQYRYHIPDVPAMNDCSPLWPWTPACQVIVTVNQKNAQWCCSTEQTNIQPLLAQIDDDLSQIDDDLWTPLTIPSKSPNDHYYGSDDGEDNIWPHLSASADDDVDGDDLFRWYNVQ